jgi:hypothetical protein
VSDQLTTVPYVYDSTALYQIRVMGKIKPNWSDRLEGMSITLSHGRGRGCITTLKGVLQGQSALFGVLRTLYDERLTLLSVTRLPED